MMHCTCSDHQMSHVGCDCGYERWWDAQLKARVTVWPKGYPEDSGPIKLTYLATDTDEEIRAKYRNALHDQIKYTATIGYIYRERPPILPIPTEAQAREMTRWDNT